MSLCCICLTPSDHNLTSIFTTVNGKIVEYSGLLCMVEFYTKEKYTGTKDVLISPPLICNSCIYQVSNEFINQQEPLLINDDENCCPLSPEYATVLPSNENKVKEEKIVEEEKNVEIVIDEEDDLLADETVYESADLPENQPPPVKNERALDDDVTWLPPEEEEAKVPMDFEKEAKVSMDVEEERPKSREKKPFSSVNDEPRSQKLKEPEQKESEPADEDEDCLLVNEPLPILAANKEVKSPKKLVSPHGKIFKKNKIKLPEKKSSLLENYFIKCPKSDEKKLPSENGEKKTVRSRERKSPSDDDEKKSSKTKEKKLSNDDDYEEKSLKTKEKKLSNDDDYEEKSSKTKEKKLSNDDDNNNEKKLSKKENKLSSEDNNEKKSSKKENKLSSEDDDEKKSSKLVEKKKSPLTENTETNTKSKDNKRRPEDNDENKRPKRRCQRNEMEIETINQDDPVSKTKDDEDFINRLSLDCLAKIFMKLKVIQRLEMEEVCPKWKKACQQSWSDIKTLDSNKLIIPLDNKNHSCKEDVLIKILKKSGSYLRDLSLTKISGSLMIPKIAAYCPDLINLELQDIFGIRGNSLERELSKMTKLESIKLQGYTINEKDAAQTHNQILLGLNKDIKDIHLQPNPHKNYVLSSEFSTTLQDFNNLRSLTLQSWDLDDKFMEIIIQKKYLTYLDLAKCNFNNDASAISSLTDLEHLNLAQVKNLDSYSVTEIVKNCKKLRYLNLFSCITISVSAIKEIEKLVDLKYLNLENLINVDGDSISGIAKNCRGLKHLNIKSCRNVSENGINDLSKLDKLEHLNLHCLFNINSRSITEITNKCRLLNYLDIGSCSNVTDTVLRDISKLTYLEHLDVRRIKNITDSVLTRISRKCWKLKYLNIEECKRLTCTGLKELTRLKYLENLIINYTNASDDIFSKMFNLKLLSCNGCQGITDLGIKNVLKNCTKLERLDINKTEVTIDTLTRAAKAVVQRKNNIVLKITINSTILESFDATKYKTTLLTLISGY